MNHRDTAQRRAITVVRNLEPPPGIVARRVLPLLVARTAENWHVLLRTGAVADGAPDAVAVGSTGVFAVEFADRLPDTAAVQALIDHVDRWSCRIRAGSGGQVLATSAVHEAVVVPEGLRPEDAADRRAQVIAEGTVEGWLRGQASRLSKAQRDSIAEQLTALLPGYAAVSVGSPRKQPTSDGLLDARRLRSDQLESAQARPFEQWMTFLHPDQLHVVTRQYSGPARISGPAGTGKTVVALHRLRHLARRSTGPLLFTTFVRTLPAVHERTFRRLAPEFDHRAEFVNLHAWVRGFLARRDIELTVDDSRALTAFNLAWAAHREFLEPVEPSREYWQTEIDRVIKGRGLRTIEQYRAIDRPGRTVRLGANQKQLVWELYETYQRNLEARDLHDYNDMVEVALRELIANPLEEHYAAVVVDEVQDITLNGLRLLRELAGDGPDALLLVGDGQQQVYAGGWRLSDAGIPIQGRGAVLKVNYRNRAELVAFARQFEARNTVDDLDGAAGVALKDVEVANPGGSHRTWQGSREALGPALTEAIAALPMDHGACAVLAYTKKDVETCAAILRGAGIACTRLEDYRGELDGPIKVGTVHRAKGLDFQGVLVVDVEEAAPPPSAATTENQDRRNRQHLVAATRARDFLWWGRVR